MHTLTNSVDWAEIVERLQSIKADDRGLWGVMNAPEMLCHLRGAFRVAMGEIPVDPINVPMPREVLKSRALWTPAFLPTGKGPRRPLFVWLDVVRGLDAMGLSPHGSSSQAVRALIYTL